MQLKPRKRSKIYCYSRCWRRSGKTEADTKLSNMEPRSKKKEVVLLQTKRQEGTIALMISNFSFLNKSDKRCHFGGGYPFIIEYTKGGIIATGTFKLALAEGKNRSILGGSREKTTWYVGLDS